MTSLLRDPWKSISILMEESYLLKEQQIISSKIQRIFAQEGQEKQGQRSFLAKKYGNNNQKVFDLMLEVKGYVSQSFGVHPATPSQKKGPTEKVRKCQGYWEKIYINNSWHLMKNQPATHFPQLLTSLDYVCPTIKTFFPNHLKLVKTDQRQGHSPDSKRSKNIISRKVKPKVSSNRNKNVSGRQKISGHKNSGGIEEGGNNTCSRIKRTICSQQFSETGKRRTLSPDNKLVKLNQLIWYSNFKMESLKQLKYLRRRNNLVTKIDLQDVYFSVALHPKTQKYVRFQWKGNLYQFLCLCFIKQSSRLFYIFAHYKYTW